MSVCPQPGGGCNWPHCECDVDTFPTRRMTQAEKAMQVINEKSGRVLCKQCSTDNWMVWHKPGEHVEGSSSATPSP